MLAAAGLFEVRNFRHPPIKTLGVEVPAGLLALADEVIE